MRLSTSIINSFIDSFLIHTPIHHPQQILQRPLGGAAATCQLHRPLLLSGCASQGGQACAVPAGVKAQGAGPSGQRDSGDEVSGGGPVAWMAGEGWERAAVCRAQGKGWGPTARCRCHPSLGAGPVLRLSCSPLHDRWHWNSPICTLAATRVSLSRVCLSFCLSSSLLSGSLSASLFPVSVCHISSP